MFSFLARLFRKPEQTPAPDPFDGPWLSRARRDLVPGGTPLTDPRFLVIHFTAGASADSSIRYWRDTKKGRVCAHFVIDRDGTVIQCRGLDRTCGHAGKSAWKGYTGLNSHSIGIELANGGSAYPTRFSDLKPITARHKNGGPIAQWEQFTPAQIKACGKLVADLHAKFRFQDIIGHEDCSPDRRNDPGPAFPMGAIREANGFPASVSG